MKQNTFIDLMNPVQDKMYRMAKRLLVSKEAAEDAIQEVMMKLWSRKQTLSSYDNLEAFAMTVTKNYCLDQLKLKGNNNLRIVHSNYEDGNPSLQKKIEVQDDLDWVQKIIENLPEQQKVLVQLREVEQYDYDEIAEMTGMQQTAIRVALSRARKKIKEEMIKRHRYGIKSN
ncbi:DNA-directed RNA polymerase sigma-70 factor [Salinimicrobium marinum]|uniref:DNA-directed RNA polymerase sigma-70 factor n=1 Tax=Salinimicrobium marinum TaxID=680283 RepID=A0A918VXM4_9FLAO|nr:RNA polymerase sigma factor [Salinimicrobium marinum]GHA34979.1 DNA-directed RNA polymerase sigma-70 factor [Salinimicrobium marinum]